MFKPTSATRSIAITLTVIALAAIGIAASTDAGWLPDASGLGAPSAVASMSVEPAGMAEYVPLGRQGFVTPYTAGVCDTAGPIEVEGSLVGTTPTAYATLGAAFTAINAGTHTGAVIIDVCGDTSEGTTVALLNASGSGAASYTSITMKPAGGAARTITGATTAGSPMIDFNGADNVTIDGLSVGGNSLTISNTTASATSGTSTIQFRTDATNNTITNSTILGSASMAVGTNGGNIFFGSGAVSTGNDNNTVSNCNLGPAGSNLPSKVIYLSGSSNTDPGTANSGIVINNNNIFDYFSPTVSSAGIDLTSGTVGTTISNNRFYQTATRTMTTTSLTHSAIRISNSSGNAYQITGNTIGFGASNGTGTYSIVTTATSPIIPINLSVNTTTATSVQGNTISGIGISGASSGTSSSGAFRAIYIGAGLVTVGDVAGNTIGSQSATGSITYTSTSASASDVIGIFNFGSSNFVSNNNNIGSITASNTNATPAAANIYGIRANTASTVTWTCNSNIIGGSVANSISSTSNATGTIVQGILDSNPALTATGNVVRNLSSVNGTGTTTSASVAGIVVNAGSAGHTLSQNTISNLTNTNTSTASVVTGIQFNGSTANVVERNLIYNLTAATTSTSAEINGIRVAGGTTTYRNNMIALGANQAVAIGAAASNSGTTGINGINEALGTDNFYHNSVYIGGTATSGTGASYAFNGTQTTNTRAFRDNIFQNARTNSGATGKNYAIKVNGTAANPTGLTINNNVYFANGASGAVFGFFSSADVANLAGWKTAVGQDANSFESNPQFNGATSSTPDLHINPAAATSVESNGVDVGVTNDYDNDIRANFTPVDIGADAGNFTSSGDIAAPVINYTPLTDSTSTANRTLATTITDASGVATGGGQPLIYYRKGTSGAYTSAAATSTSGSTYTFTISYASVGGVVGGDVIQYYVAAQDTVGNSGTSPAGGTGVNPPGATAPATPNQYNVLFSVSAFPYTQDFETNSTGWTTGVLVGTTTDWVLGTPAKTQITGAHSGTKAWVTKTTGSYTISTTSTLVSPIVDMSTLSSRPTLTFWHNFKTEAGFDAGAVDYSTDGGSTWTKLDANLGTGGTFNTTDSTYWYNSSSTNGTSTLVLQPKFSTSSTGYTGAAAGWIQSTVLLPSAVVGQANVRLRWVLGSDSSTADEGWAVDDINIAPPNPGSLQFSSATYGGNEGAGVTVTVNRTGGSAGAVAVSYATGGGNATAGTCGSGGDYVATNGTLNWADTDSAPKTFTVQLCSDNVTDPGETVNLTLSSATGGASITGTNPAVLTITDVPPPLSGTVPVGTLGTYTSLTNTGGLFDAINASGVSGNVTVNITSDLTAETGTVALNAFASPNTLKINPVTAARTISGSSTGCLIKLNGTDRVTIDGSLGGSGIDRSLTIANTSTGTSSAVVCLQSPTVSDGATGDTVKNSIITGNASTTTLFGIYSGGATVGTAVPALTANSGNTFQNNKVSKAQYGIFVNGVSTSSLDTGTTISFNNFGSSTAGDGFSVSAVSIKSQQGAAINGNDVQNVAGTGSTNMTGISVTDSKSTGVSANKVHALSYTGTSTTKVYGIYSIGTTFATAGTASTNTFVNNFVYDMASTGTSSLWNLSGINNEGGYGDKYYLNSVSITGQTSNGTGPSAAFSIGNGITSATSTSGGFDVRDNAFSMTGTSPSTPVNYAHYTTLANYTGSTIDYNDLYIAAGGTATVKIGRLNGVDSADIVAWRSATSLETNSISANPNFNSATDLHISGVPLADAGTAIAGFTSDIDGEPRPQGSAYDIGADELIVGPGTLQLSSATYSGNENTNLTVTVNRVSGSAGTVGVTATLADAGGAVGGAACGVGVDYVNAGPQTLSFANGVTTQSFNVQLCADLVTDPSETFTVTLSNATGGASLGSPTAATVTINDVPPPLAGAYTVGTGGNYTSLTNAGGIFASLNLSGASGPVTINITSDLTGETGANALNELNGGFAVVIKPSGGARSITGSAASGSAIIKLYGADNVTIDGSQSGGTDQSLTITNTGTGTVIWIGTNATSGSNNDTIKNCILIGAGSFTGQGIIAGSGVTNGNAAEFPQSNNNIRNNLIKSVQNAAFIAGNVAAQDQNWNITGNTFGSSVTAEKLAFRGMLIRDAANFVITRNTITGVSSSTSSSSTMSGIHLAGVINGGSVTRNLIRDIKQNNTTGWGSNGIYLASSSTAANVLIANNFISDVASQGFAGATSTDNGYGIMIDSGAGYNIYDNTVVLTTNQSTAGAISAALNIAAAVTTAGGLNIRGNILASTQTLQTRYAIYDASTAGNAIFAAGGINYNDYFAQNVGFLTSAQATLANWQTASGQDANSLAADPLFVSASDFHLQAGSTLANAGVDLRPTVANDFDGQPRPAGTAAEIGADELTDSVNPTVTINTSAAGTPPASTTITSATFTFSATDSLTAPTVVASYECALDSPFTFSPCTSPKNYTGLGLGSHTFKVHAIDTSGNVSADATYTWTINPANSAPVASSFSVNVTAGNSVVITMSATDADSNQLTFTITGSQANGFITTPSAPVCNSGTCTSSFTYTPNNGYIGPDQIRYKANDGLVDSAEANISITVNPASCAAAPSGLVAWYRGEGNANDTQGPTFENGTNSGLTFGTGRVGQAFVGNGVSGAYASLGNPAVFNIQDFTAGAWVKRSSAAVVSNNPAGPLQLAGLLAQDTNGWGFGMFPNGRLILTKVGVDAVNSSAVTVADTNYHYVAVTKSGSTVTFYVDGVPETVGPYNPGFANNGGGTSIGRFTSGAGEFFGQIDEVQFYSRALSNAEIQGLYDTSSAGSCVTTYAVTYDGNSNTGGAVPVDGNSPYASGSIATVLGNTGNLVRTGYTFTGWNTAADGSGTAYQPAATFQIGAATTLYAQWAALPTVTTQAATAVTASTATLNGLANPNGSATTGWFRYATTSPGTCNDTFGTRAPVSGGSNLGGGSSAVAYSQGISGLTNGSTYFFCAIASSSAGTSFGSLQSFVAQSPEPTVQASNIAFSNITQNSMTVSWTNGNGAARIVVGSDQPITFTPTDNTSYATGSTVVPNHAFILYNGTGNTFDTSSVPVTLPGNTQFYFQVFEYNGTAGNENYLTTTATNNPNTQSTPVATYTWNGSVDTDWAKQGNWTPIRTPGNGDILQFNSGGSKTVANLPTETEGQILITNSTNMTFQKECCGPTSFNITGQTGDDLVVGAGSRLTILTPASTSNTNALFINLQTGTTGKIGGIVSMGSLSPSTTHKITAADAGALHFLNGSTFISDVGEFGGPFANASPTTNSVIFENGSTYVHNGGGSPFGLAATVPLIFQTGSLYKYQYATTPAFAPDVNGRTYANVEYNSTLSTTSNGSSPFTADNVTVTQGIWSLKLTGTGHSVKGNLTTNGGTLDMSPASAGTLTFNGTSAQTISGAGGILVLGSNQNVTFDNAAGINLSKSITVNGGLALTNGIVTATGSNVLTLGSAASVARTNGYVIGSLQKTYGATGAFTYPIGTANGYSPVNFNVTAQSGGSVTVRADQTAHPNLVNSAKALTRYWTISGSGVTTDMTFNYLDGDIPGTANENNFVIAKYNAGWSRPGGSVNAAANTATITGVSSFSGWTLAEVPAFNNPPSITPSAVSRQEGSTSANVTIATVSDTEDSAGSLPVTVNGGATATVNGVTVSNITNTAGTIKADVIAGCGAANAGFTLSTTDSLGSTATATLNVTVSANTSPNVTYSNVAVNLGGATTNSTTTATDNGSISGFALQSPGTYTGGIAVNPSTGQVTFTGAAPAGTHTITVRATDNCGAFTDAQFTVSVTAPDYTVVMSAGSLTVTDVSGNTDTLAISEPGPGQIKFAAASKTFSLNGGPFITGDSGNVSLASITQITVNAQAGDDTISVGGFTSSLPGLTLNGGTGNDAVQFNGNIAFASNANLDVDLQNDDPNPGSDDLIQLLSGQLTLSGSGSATFKCSRFISMSGGTGVQSVNGNITMEANQQAVPTLTGGIGINIDGATVKATGAGIVAVRGKGGSNVGISVTNGSLIQGGLTLGTTTTILDGTGGSQATNMHGVQIGSNGLVTSFGGDVSVTGQGGTAGSTNLGIILFPGAPNGGKISSTGNGSVTVNGTGGVGGNDDGIRIDGAGSSITAGGSGAINVTGTAGASGPGISISRQGAIQSTTGIVTVTGTGTGGGNGIQMLSSNTNVTSGGNATVSLIADTMDLSGAQSISANAGIVNIRQKTNGRSIDLGGADGPTQLGLTDVELDRVTAGVMNIGDANSGNTQVDGAITQTKTTNLLSPFFTTVSSSGSLGIFGTTTTGINVNSGGTLAPGASPGIINTGSDLNMGAGSNLAIEIGGATPGNGSGFHDQVNVTGAVNLDGNLSVANFGGFIPAFGQTFVIINNDGADAVNGTFAGLPAGTSVPIGGSGRTAKIFYNGGDGNDVVLTVDAIPGTLQFSSATYSVGEAGPNVILTVTRTGGGDGPISANYSLGGGSATGGSCSGGADYDNTGGSVSFANGDTANKTITVPICDDAIYESAETFVVTLAGATLGSPSAATVTINDNDSAPTFAVNDVSVNEGDSGLTNMTFTITRTGATAFSSVVNFHTADGTATVADNDYQPILAGSAPAIAACSASCVTFLASDTTKQVTVKVVGDITPEPDEVLHLLLDSVTNGTIIDGDGLGTITNDDAVPVVQFSSPTYIDDESQDIVFTITRTGNISIPSTVNFSTTGGGTAGGGGACAPGVDYVTVTGQPVSFTAGQASRTISVTTCGDNTIEPPDTFNVALSSPSIGTIGAQSTAQGVIRDAASRFTNHNSIDLTLGGNGSIYPSQISVSGAPTVNGGMRVTLYDVSHAFPDNIDVLLVDPQGRKYVLMADAGGPTSIDPTGAVTLTFDDFATQVLPDSDPLTTGKFKPTSWETPVSSFASPAPGAPYNEPGSSLTRPPGVTFANTFGGFDPNGTWTLYVRDDAGQPLTAPDTAIGSIAGGWGLQFFAPTAAGVQVSGRVMTATGGGLRNARVVLTDQNGVTRAAVTNAFGYYTFDDVAAGRTYLVGVESRNYTYTTRVVQVFDTLTDVDFSPQ